MTCTSFFSRLTNLGNTCFMSTGLQCLAHTPALSDYFLDGRYVPKKDAKIANEFGEVVREIYRETDEDCARNYYFHRSSSAAAFEPRTFVDRFASEAPMFGDARQHDCQVGVLRLALRLMMSHRSLDCDFCRSFCEYSLTSCRMISRT